MRALAVLLKDGEAGSAPLSISVPPSGGAELPIPEGLLREMEVQERAALSLGKALPEFALTVSFRLREDTLWAKAGHEIAFGQKVWKREVLPCCCTEDLTVVRGKWNLGVRGRRFSAQFSAIRPGLTSYVYNGVELIEQIPMPNFWRAPNDNDRGNGMPQRYAQWKIASLYVTGKDPRAPLFPELERKEHSVLVTFRCFMPTRPRSECRVATRSSATARWRPPSPTRRWRACPTCRSSACSSSSTRTTTASAGTAWGRRRTTWTGRRGARLGVYETTAEQNLSRYLVPQECGNRCGVRWAKVMDRRGRGMEFAGDELSVNVLPWTPHELENAAHAYELPPVHYTVVRVALQQMGVGGDDSWGARTHPEDLLPAGQDLTLRFRFKGI